MTWLDLGIVRHSTHVEIHPWGPFLRGYIVPKERVASLVKRNRWIKAAAVLVSVVLVGEAVFTWNPVLIFYGLGAAFAEILVTWLCVKDLARTQKPLGWDEGLIHFVKGLNRNLLIATHWAIKVLIVLSIILVIREPDMWEPYLLLGTLVGIQFVLVYLEYLQRSGGPKA